MNRVKDKVVIVTGAALGIGRASCSILAQEGARVAVTDVLDTQGREVVDAIERAGGAAGYWHLDVSREEEVKKAFQDIHARFGKVNVLVNNAGISGVDKPTEKHFRGRVGPSHAHQCQRCFPLHQAHHWIFAGCRRREHHQYVIHLRAGRRRTFRPITRQKEQCA